MPCTSLRPGHATSLTGVKRALALRHDPHRAPVPVRIGTIYGERITLQLPGGTLEARCHDAGRLAALRCRATPVARFTAVEHQLLVEVDPETVPTVGAAVYVSPASSTGTYAAFNLALPWHDDVPCGVLEQVAG